MSVNYYNNGTLKNISGGGGGAVSYTTEEVPTGGTWVDGKPIYRKVITTAPTLMTSSGGVYSYDFAETITGVETIIEMKGFFNSNTSTTNGYFLPLPETSYYDQAHMIELILYQGKVRITTRAEINLSTTSSWQVTIEYTKVN